VSHTEFMLWNREMIIYMQNVSLEFKKERQIFALLLIHFGIKNREEISGVNPIAVTWKLVEMSWEKS
jgi:hypothetical protein